MCSERLTTGQVKKKTCRSKDFSVQVLFVALLFASDTGEFIGGRSSHGTSMIQGAIEQCGPTRQPCGGATWARH